MPKDDWLKLAILYDPHAKYSPSNHLAIDRFCESAIKHNLLPVLVGQDDEINETEYAGLLIRDTTHPNHYTYEWSILASTIGLKVIDSPLAIQQGCNKIWQTRLFEDNNISHPKTWKDNYEHYRNNYLKLINTENSNFPCIIKIPDSCFSQGVFKCNDLSEYISILKNISKDVICQEFIETKYDWRITLFNHKFLFAVKYYMVDNDWKIIKYDRKGDYVDGKHECIRFEDIPLCVLAEAEKVNRLLTDGLYGIDVKEVNGKAYVIEINDNPSIDGDVEDEIECNSIYDTIIQYFR